MIQINSADVPILPVKSMIGGECVAFGINDDGIVIQYMNIDKCVFLEWADVIQFGLEALTAKPKPPSEPEEIAAPTVNE